MEKIVLQKSIVPDTDEKAIIRPYNFTMNPRAWERDSLYIATHNGGVKPEKFHMVDQKISHGDIYSTLISARHGFGNTEGLFVIGDKNKSIMIGDSETDANAAKAAGIPIILLKYGYTEKRSNEIYHNHLVKDFIGIEKIVSEYL